jgi:arylsulfatase
LGGAPIPENTDGISFVPTLFDKKQKNQHAFLYWEFPAYNGQQAVRMGRWKGIRKDIFDGNMNIELYNLEQDPNEQNDVSAEQPDIIQRIEQIMKDQHTPSEIERFKFPQLRD